MSVIPRLRIFPEVPSARREGRAVLPEEQLLAVLLGFHQDAEGFFGLPHQVQVHLLIVWHIDLLSLPT